MSTVFVLPANRKKNCPLPEAPDYRATCSRPISKDRVGAALLAVWLSTVAAAAQTQGSAPPAPAPAPQEAAKEAPPAPAPPPSLPSYISLSKRDPFKSPLDKSKVEKQPTVEVIDVPPPRNRRPPGPTGFLISEIVLQGIVQGMGTKVAMVSGGGSITYFLHEGERLYDGVIREIGDSYVKFVREIKSNNIVVRQQEVTVSVHPAP